MKLFAKKITLIFSIFAICAFSNAISGYEPMQNKREAKGKTNDEVKEKLEQKAEKKAEKKDIIELKITKSVTDNLEATILNLSEEAKQLNFDKISILGKKTLSQDANQKKPITRITWDKAALKEKEIDLTPYFESKVVVGNNLETGDSFKARGDRDALAKALERLMKQSENKLGNYMLLKKSKASSAISSSSSSDSFVASSGTNSSSNRAAQNLKSGYGSYSSSSTDSPSFSSTIADSYTAGQSDTTIATTQDKTEGKTEGKTEDTVVATQADSTATEVKEEVTEVSVPAEEEVAAPATQEVVQEEATAASCSTQIDYYSGKAVKTCNKAVQSFPLEKDYDMCPSTIDVATRKVLKYFQYFYTDENNGMNTVDTCQIDASRSTPLSVEESFACSDYVDRAGKVAYMQSKMTYKDSDNQEIILSDCSVNYQKSFPIIEDSSSCSLRHLFDEDYSVVQNRLYYTKNGEEITVQACQDSSRKYQHYSTSESCAPTITKSQVTTYSRKYINIDGIKQYISECAPLSSNIAIQSENCTSTPYTHDFTSGQSFRNKNYFYYDGNNRVEVSSCVKSEEVYAHAEDSGVCSEQNDDVAMQSTIFSKKYITVDANRVYISNCAATAAPIPYQEVGYKWVTEYNLASTSITPSGVSDRVFIGSKQGVETSTGRATNSPGETKLTGQFLIANYSTTGKCNSYNSLSYDGNPIDLSYSNPSTIQYDNFVEQVGSAAMCHTNCGSWHCTTNYNCNICENPYRVCEREANILYYQRSNNYHCPVYKFARKPILRRRNGSEITNNTKTLENKFACGDSGLNGTIRYY